MTSTTSSQIPTFSRTGVYGIALEMSKILVVKQQHTAMPGKFDLPGGGIEPGETIAYALHREFGEEVAMDFDSMEMFENLTAVSKKRNPEGEPYFFHQIGLIYRVEGLTPLANQSPELEFFWVDPTDLREEDCCPLLAGLLPLIREKTIQKLEKIFR